MERLGRLDRTLAPGLSLVVPFVERVRIVDTREQALDLATHEAMTHDRAAVAVQTRLRYRPTDPRQVATVPDVPAAVAQELGNRLDAVLADLTYEQVSSSPHELEASLLESLRTASEGWGIDITHLELVDIIYRPTPS